MPTPKSEFEQLYPCDFYTPEQLFEDDQMYTVYEIARLLQGLDADAEIDRETEDVLLDWAIPWVMNNAAELAVAEPPTDEEPGYYGLAREGDLSGVPTDSGVVGTTGNDQEEAAGDDQDGATGGGQDGTTGNDRDESDETDG